MQRNKGKRYEQAVASGYRAVYPELADKIKRGWQSREGHDAADVEGVPQRWIECKHHKRVSIRAAFDQAVAACTKAGSLHLPTVHTKDNNCEALVTIRETDWWNLLSRLRHLEERASATANVPTFNSPPGRD